MLLRLRLVPFLLLIAALASPALLTAAQAAPRARQAPVTLTVFAAASLTEAFQDLGQRYERQNPGVKVTFNFAGSQTLVQQLGQGAPADVFASANAAQMDLALKTGRVSSSATLARNRLIVIYPASNPGEITDLPDLARPGLQLVLGAASVPVGHYALDLLDKASADPAFGAAFKTGVLNNVVSYEENVKAVVAKVLLGEADAGIVYATDILGVAPTQVRRLSIPGPLNISATYPIAVIDDSAQLAAARDFVRFTLSPEGQSRLRLHGFSTLSPLLPPKP